MNDTPSATKEQLDRIEALLKAVLERQDVREWYTPKEFAAIIGKAEWTVRNWCRLGRIHAKKRDSGSGEFGDWAISNDELHRYQRDGLLPLRRTPS